MSAPEHWREEALLLIGHGASRFADAGRILRAHAGTLRDAGHFAEVAVGWLNDAPAAAEALAGLSTRVVHVVPFFMEQGWFVREAIPAALGAGHGHVLNYHPPVGVHPRMAELAAARVADACGPEAARCSVLLVGHGSARAPGRRMALHRHADLLAGDRRFAQARAGFLSEAPFVADALAQWRTEPVAVIGFLAGEGGHAQDDLPRALATERELRAATGAPLLDLGMITDDPAMPGIILAQAATGN